MSRPAATAVVGLRRAAFDVPFTVAVVLSIASIAGAAQVPDATVTRAAATGLREATYCVDPDWAPYEVIDESGRHVGISADLLRLAAERAGVRLRLVPTKDWDESLAAVKDGRCEMLSFLNETPKRLEWLIFTAPLYTDPNAIITREDHPFVADLAEIADETLVLPRGTAIEEWVRRDFPWLRIVLVDSEADAFAAVAERKADLTIRAMTVAVYTIKKDGWFSLKISGHIPGYENHLRVGVRKDLTVLRDRLNDGVTKITPEERARIANGHVAIRVEMAADWALIAKILLGFAVVLATNAFWIAKLRAANQRLRKLSLTDGLTGLANRANLNACVVREMERSTRYGRPFSVILFDLDRFKRVNDAFGHLAGDRLLQCFAAVANGAARKSDVVGRWGGEEFLILCPETTLEQAVVLADRVRESLREQPFEGNHRATASAGIAALRDGDTMDSLLHRADIALYEAKGAGRDRVAVAH